MGTHRNPDLTRRGLLQAAFEEIYKSGFQAASLNTILSNAGVTKGALYHHFGSKKQLGYAVVDELIREHVREAWERPLERAEDPIEALLDILRHKKPPSKFSSSFSLRLGCPLNNLAQEMSPLDEGFRKRLESVFREWREVVTKALRRGQEEGHVRADVDPSAAANFLMAAIEGSVSLAKNAQDGNLLNSCKEGLAHYLQTLRPREKRQRAH